MGAWLGWVWGEIGQYEHARKKGKARKLPLLTISLFAFRDCFALDTKLYRFVVL